MIVAKDIETQEYHIFRDLPDARNRFIDFCNSCELCIGHNILGYDIPVIERLLEYRIPVEKVIDTYTISRLLDYPREKHSIEDYGREFNLLKGDFHDFSKYSQLMEDYCIRDVDICHRVYLKYRSYIDRPESHDSILTESKFQLVCNKLNAVGFALDVRKTTNLLTKVENQLGILDKDLTEAFPPRLKLIREVTPKETKYGTINRASIPHALRDCIEDFSPGCPFSYCAWTAFNPDSHPQRIRVLREAGWQPTVKTDSHKDTERELQKKKRLRHKTLTVDLELNELYAKLKNLEIYGWKINEENLSTLPDDAPPEARLLAKRILYESRRRTLTEWKQLVQDDGRVHGTFQAIGAWTHRMAHQKPNVANITNEMNTNDTVKLLGKELRQCWIAPKGRLLVGVDAEGIQLRIFAHIINDKELIDAIVSGSKADKTDAHSLNKIVLGAACRTRSAAKRYLYALFLGAGQDKLCSILECSRAAGDEAFRRLMDKYPGFEECRTKIIPADAKRGWFIGLDGRRVRIVGEDVGTRRHLAMSGYLQNGEKVVMATATCEFEPRLKDFDSFLVDLVHDEWQNECPNDFVTCQKVAEMECQALVDVGKKLNLNCPLAGSYRNDHGDFTFGNNWYETH